METQHSNTNFVNVGKISDPWQLHSEDLEFVLEFLAGLSLLDIHK